MDARGLHDGADRTAGNDAGPGAAGFRSTWALLNFPMTWCGSVAFLMGTITMLLLAFSMLLRMASETSFALPKPYPTRPARSPTTVRAEKENRRPPLTTFATRLSFTSFSRNSPWFLSLS